MPHPPRWKIWLLASRPKTLFAAVSPVLLAALLAIGVGGFHLLSALAALVCAMLIQVGTNFANDADDYVRGADTEARKGPLRAVAAGFVSPQAMKRAAMTMFGLAFVLGLYLVWRGGWPILVVGVVSILSGIAYTAGRYALAYTGLADVFVLVFFGPVAVGGTFFVQALMLPAWPVIIGLGPGFLATAILLANNVRDVKEDRAAGKQTLVVRFGRSFGVTLYRICIAGAVAVPAAFAFWRMDHVGVLAASLLATFVGRRLARTLVAERDSSVLNPLLGKTALLLFGYCLAFGVGFVLT